MTDLSDFMTRFACYRLAATQAGEAAPLLREMATGRRPLPGPGITNIEAHAGYFEFFSFRSAAEVGGELASLGLHFPPDALETIPMNMEDAFVGYTGRC